MEPYPQPQPIGQTLASLAAAAGIHGRDVREKAVSREPQAVAKGCANTGVTVMGTARILRGRKRNMTGNLALPLTQRSKR